MADVLCVGAHPDDVEIGMGGTIAGMVRAGLDVAIVDITDGEPTPAGTPEIRATEAAEAAATLGVSRRVTLESAQPLPVRHARGADGASRGGPGAQAPHHVRAVS